MIDWRQIDTLFLDMDGTLLDLRYDNYFWNQYLPQRYAEIHAMDPRDASELLDAHYRARRGTLDWYSVDFWSRTLNLDILSLKQEVSSLIRYRDHATLFLEHMTDRPLARLIITNAHPSIVALKDRHTGLCTHVDRVICSHDLGFPKEDPEFWRALAGVVDFEPQRTLLIDDNVDVLEAASNHGILHLLGIERPDSGQAPVTDTRFPTLSDFRQLLPN